MDQRKAAILRAIVEEYVASAQPVGSETIARTRHLGVSAATVRNEMVALEGEGYIAQPHVSAGRVPTPLGYRYFVDHTDTGPLDRARARTVSAFFTQARGALEGLLHETSILLSRLTEHAAVVLAPESQGAIVRSVQLVDLTTATALVVAVLSNGAVIREVVDLDGDATPELLASVSGLLAEHLVGVAFDGSSCPSWGHPRPAGSLASRAHAALARGVEAALAEQLFVGGTSRIAAESDDFPAAERTVARLLELFEQQFELVASVRRMLSEDVIVRIGPENELPDLHACSVVLAPYSVNGRVAGTLGIVGPTRMDYPRTVAAVGAVSEGLSKQLSSS